MDQTGLWLTPLILLPGVALLVMSTSSRYGRIHDEVHHLFAHGEKASPIAIARLRVRARLFRDSLLALYVCIGLFSLSSLFGMLALTWLPGAEWIGATILVSGIAFLFGATVQLIRESSLSLGIIEDHLLQLDHELPEPGTTPGRPETNWRKSVTNINSGLRSTTVEDYFESRP